MMEADVNAAPEIKPKLKLKVMRDKDREDPRAGSAGASNVSTASTKRKASSSTPGPAASKAGSMRGDGSPPAPAASHKKIKRESGQYHRTDARSAGGRPGSGSTPSSHRDERYHERSPPRDSYGRDRERDGSERPSSGRHSYDRGNSVSGDRYRYRDPERESRRVSERRYERAPSEYSHHGQRSSLPAPKASHSPPLAPREHRRSDVYNSLSTASRGSGYGSHRH